MITKRFNSYYDVLRRWRRIKFFLPMPLHNYFSIAVSVLSTGVLLTLLSCNSGDRMAGYIYYRLSTNPTTLDPALIVDVQGGSIAAKLFNGLVRLDERMNVIPDIAERWEIDKSGKVYTFYLKKGVRFSGGREVTASDFEYSFKRILDPENNSPNTWVLEKISGAKDYMEKKSGRVSGMETAGRYIFRLRLDEPFSPFLYLLTMTAAYVIPHEEVERLGPDFSTHPSGTGPFVIEEWRHNAMLVLKRNNAYFESTAKCKGIVYRIIPEDLTAVTEFEMGNLDVITIPSFEYSRFKNSSKWKDLILSADGLDTYYIGFNCSRPPFDNVKIRKAIAYSIDRDKIFRTFFEERGRPASGPVPDKLRRWDIPPLQAYNPLKAKEMVKEAGAQGLKINFYITADQEVIDMAEIIQSYIKEAGLDVRIKQLEWSAYKAALNKGEADMFWIGWWADYPDPENFLFPLFHSSNQGAGGNRTWYSNGEADSLIEKGREAMDIRKRDNYYKNAERIIVEDSPWVFFWHRNDFALRQPYLKNFTMYPIYSMDKGTEVSF